MIKVIAFDYAGVITPGPMTSWTKENLKNSGEKYKLYKSSGDKWDLGEMVESEVFDVLSEVTGISPDQIWEKIYLRPKLNLEVISLIKTLKNNYKIFLFSNFVGSFLRKLLEKDGIYNLFDEIIVSSDYGFKKPDASFFEVLVSHAGVGKNEIIFTDDAIENVKGGNNFGIKSILFTNAEKLTDDLRKSNIKI